VDKRRRVVGPVATTSAGAATAPQAGGSWLGKSSSSHAALGALDAFKFAGDQAPRSLAQDFAAGSAREAVGGSAAAGSSAVDACSRGQPASSSSHLPFGGAVVSRAHGSPTSCQPVASAGEQVAIASGNRCAEAGVGGFAQDYILGGSGASLGTRVASRVDLRTELSHHVDQQTSAADAASHLMSTEVRSHPYAEATTRAQGPDFTHLAYNITSSGTSVASNVSAPTATSHPQFETRDRGGEFDLSRFGYSKKTLGTRLQAPTIGSDDPSLLANLGTSMASRAPAPPVVNHPMGGVGTFASGASPQGATMGFSMQLPAAASQLAGQHKVAFGGAQPSEEPLFGTSFGSDVQVPAIARHVDAVRVTSSASGPTCFAAPALPSHWSPGIGATNFDSTARAAAAAAGTDAHAQAVSSPSHAGVSAVAQLAFSAASAGTVAARPWHASPTGGHEHTAVSAVAHPASPAGPTRFAQAQRTGSCDTGMASGGADFVVPTSGQARARRRSLPWSNIPTSACLKVRSVAPSATSLPQAPSTATPGEGSELHRQPMAACMEASTSPFELHARAEPFGSSAAGSCGLESELGSGGMPGRGMAPEVAGQLPGRSADGVGSLRLEEAAAGEAAQGARDEWLEALLM